MAIGQILYNVPIGGSLVTNITSNITEELIDGKTVSKLGIQAPPGTIFQINNGNIVIGRTGIYEIQDVKINSLKGVKQPVYHKDMDATQKAGEDAVKGFNEALSNIENTTASIINLDSIVTQHNKYLASFNKAYQDYLQYKYGVYVKDAENTDDLYNIIIDYEYEEGGNK